MVLMLGTMAWGDTEERELTILFTHDLHSHLEKFPQIARLVRDIRSGEKDCLWVDSGDFSMGTLYQTLYANHAPELTLLGEMGCDAITLGNHELDYGVSGLAQMLQTAAQSESRPAMICSDIDWSRNTGEACGQLQAAMAEYGVQTEMVLEVNGIRVGLFSLMGQEAAEYASPSGMVFEDNIQTARVCVARLEEMGADVIICLSHSGTGSDPDRSEDELLAKAVPQIDLIISGHTHTWLYTPIVHGQTWIASCGEYAQAVGEVQLKERDGEWVVTGYQLHAMAETTDYDKKIRSRVREYQEWIDVEYLSTFAYSQNQVLADNRADFGSFEAFGQHWGDHPYGSFLADACLYAIHQAEGDVEDPVVAAIVPEGTIRAVLPQGDVTVKAGYEVASLGMGADGSSGYPLVAIYLTGRELRAVAEVDASVAQLMGGTKLYPAGIGWQYNTNRMLLDRVTGVWLLGENGEKLVLEDDKLYRVAANFYSAQMLGTVKSKSFGLLSIEPKDKNGQPVTDYEACIVKWSDSGRELKEWEAVTRYLESFGGVIPEEQGRLQARKIRYASWNPVDLLQNPGKVSWIVMGAGAAVIAILTLLTVGIVRTVKKHRKKKK